MSSRSSLDSPRWWRPENAGSTISAISHPGRCNRRLFTSNWKLAARVGKPVFLHQRDAHEDFLSILKEHRQHLSGGVTHCFTGSGPEMRSYLEMGFAIGITGWICDERRGAHLLPLMREIPSDRLLLETDGPYLLPRDLHPKPASRRNEPSFLPHIAAVVARARDRIHRGARARQYAGDTRPLPPSNHLKLSETAMDLERLRTTVRKAWDESILDRLTAYIRIPNKSPAFDPQWEAHGHMEKAVQLMAEWCRAQPIPGMKVEIRRLPGKTPLLLVDIPGELPGCVLLYGHLDKQPEFTGWLPGLGPWEPVIRDGKLYGRGAPTMATLYSAHSPPLPL